MAVFPLFVDLKGKKCVVIGGGRVALRKIQVLLGFHASIVVISPMFEEKLLELKWQDKVMLIKKKYETSDVEEAFLVLAATSDQKENQRVAEDAKRLGIFVNVADNPKLCTFLFPSVIKRGDIVIGVSTSGSYPMLSKKLKEKIEEVVPSSYEGVSRVLKSYRQKVLEEIEDKEKRKQIIEKLMDEMLFYEDSITEQQLQKRIDALLQE